MFSYVLNLNFKISKKERYAIVKLTDFGLSLTFKKKKKVNLIWDKMGLGVGRGGGGCTPLSRSATGYVTMYIETTISLCLMPFVELKKCLWLSVYFMGQGPSLCAYICLRPIPYTGLIA